MAASAVTPVAGLVSIVAAGGTAVNAAGPILNGGFITNPASAADQGISDPPESIFVSPVSPSTLQANGVTFEIPPGETWTMIPGQTTNTSVNAATSGHKFSIVVW